MVYSSYLKVCDKKGSAGIDKETIGMFNEDLRGNLYKVWNRMSSGSYFQPAVHTVLIPKKQVGTRPLGISQFCVAVRSYLRQKNQLIKYIVMVKRLCQYKARLLITLTTKVFTQARIIDQTYQRTICCSNSVTFPTLHRITIVEIIALVQKYIPKVKNIGSSFIRCWVKALTEQFIVHPVSSKNFSNSILNVFLQSLTISKASFLKGNLRVRVNIYHKHRTYLKSLCRLLPA